MFARYHRYVVTVLVAAPERTASRVVDALSNRVRTESTIADARAFLAADPTLVLVSDRLDGESTDLLAAVRSGEHCDPDTPVLELAATDDDGTDPDLPETEPTLALDDRVSLADLDALRAAVRLAVAVSEYREATRTLYDLSRDRSDGDSIDPAAIDDARRVADDRLTTVQRAAGGRTPFHRLLSE